MSDLLKEAIADAKAVRETALQNAKMALEEAFTPQLKNMLSAKLKQEEDAVEGDPVVEDEEMDDEEVEEIPIEDGDDMGDDTDGDVNINIDADDDDEEGPEEGYHEDEEAEEDEVEEDFEIEEDNLDLEAIIKELEDELSEGEHGDEEDEVEESTESSEETVEENEAKEVDAVEEEYEIDEDTLKEEEEEEEEVEESNTSELEAELKEYKEAVSFLKDKLHEVNILNAKLLFTNKLFKEFALDNNQKLKVVETFDRAQTTREIKLVYSTLAEQLGDNGSINRKVNSIKESASSAVGSTKPSTESKKVISEESQVADRFRKLAGILND